MNSKIYIHRIIMLAIAAVVFLGCKRDDEELATPSGDNNTQLYFDLYQLMKDWYLWNDKVPSIDVARFSDIEEEFQALQYKALDKWSFMMDTIAFQKYFEEGEMIGYGIGMQLDAERNLRVTYVYGNSPMDRQKISRGFKILKVNGKDVSQLINNNTFSKELGADKAGMQATFEVEDLLGNKKTISIAKEEIRMKTVIHRSVIERAGKKVGYLVFNTFIENSIPELEGAFDYFQSEGVSELVLDLRYNGGGSLEVATYLASLIGGGQIIGKKFVELTYNPKQIKENKPFLFKPTPHSLKLNKVLVITTKSSASASEAVISGLEPYMPVYVIGDDTHGKPVGMNIFVVGKYAVAPITFKVANSNGESDYYQGLKADVYAQDDLNYDFGDEKESSLNQALYFIENGIFSAPNARSYANLPQKRLELTGFRAEVGAF